LEEIVVCASKELLKKQLYMRVFLKLVTCWNLSVNILQFEVSYFFEHVANFVTKRKEKNSIKKVKLTCEQVSMN